MSTADRRLQSCATRRILQSRTVLGFPQAGGAQALKLKAWLWTCYNKGVDEVFWQKSPTNIQMRIFNQ